MSSEPLSNPALLNGEAFDFALTLLEAARDQDDVTLKGTRLIGKGLKDYAKPYIALDALSRIRLQDGDSYRALTLEEQAELRQMAKLVDDGRTKKASPEKKDARFDGADAFYALAHPEILPESGRDAFLRRLRALFFLPEENPEGLDLNFYTAPFEVPDETVQKPLYRFLAALGFDTKRAGQVASVEIVKTDGSTDRQKVTFLRPGMFHSIMHMWEEATRRAQAGERVIVVDPLCSGGSELLSHRGVMPSDLDRSLTASVTRHTESKDHCTDINHSLTTIPMADTERARQELGYACLEKNGRLTPVPGRPDMLVLGSNASPYFRDMLGQVIFNGGEIHFSRETLTHYFFPYPPADPAERERKLRAVEVNPFDGNLLSLALIWFFTSRHPIVDSVEATQKTPDTLNVMTQDDALFGLPQNHDLDFTAGVYTTNDPASHNLAVDGAPSRPVQSLQHAMNGGFSENWKAPYNEPLNFRDHYRHLRWINARIGAFARGIPGEGEEFLSGIDPHLVLSVGRDLTGKGKGRAGGAIVAEAGIPLGLRADGLVGTSFHAALLGRLEPFYLPVDMAAGVEYWGDLHPLVKGCFYYSPLFAFCGDIAFPNPMAEMPTPLRLGFSASYTWNEMAWAKKPKQK